MPNLVLIFTLLKEGFDMNNNEQNKKEHNNQDEKGIYLTEMDLEEFLNLPKEEIQRMFENMANKKNENKKRP